MAKQSIHLAGSFKPGIVECRHRGQTPAQVVDGGGHGGEGGHQVQPGQGQRQIHKGKAGYVQGEEAPHRFHHPGRDAFGADPDRDLGTGMNQTRDLTQPLLDQQQEANHLDTTAGGTGTTTNEAGKQQH